MASNVLCLLYVHAFGFVQRYTVVNDEDEIDREDVQKIVLRSFDPLENVLIKVSFISNELLDVFRHHLPQNEFRVVEDRINLEHLNDV
ncbi:MAG: hypothetical protein NUV80_06530 [Candidatus Berkelbacteria bacterium]|nr:hypothetical protein [Candidatus Berkelbacteria bacterium]